MLFQGVVTDIAAVVDTVPVNLFHAVIGFGYGFTHRGAERGHAQHAAAVGDDDIVALHRGGVEDGAVLPPAQRLEPRG